MCEVCSKFTLRTPEWRKSRRFSVVIINDIVDFEQVNAGCAYNFSRHVLDPANMKTWYYSIYFPNVHTNASSFIRVIR